MLSSHGRKIGTQDALKKESRGLSQVAAGNPGFPRLVPVTRIHFSKSRALWGGRSGRTVTSPSPSPVEVAPRTELTTAPATLLNCVTVARTDGHR